MKTKLGCFLLAAAIAAVFLAGCSTVESRIKDNPDVFNQLTPEQQALVKAGHIALGFNPEAVKLALGDPDRVVVRTDGDGDTVIWHYVTYEAGGVMLYSGYYHGAHRGGWWGPAYPYYLDYPNRRERDRFRVEFKRDRVSSITQDLSA